MCIAGINCYGTLTHFSGRVRGADSGGTKLTTRSFIPNPCILHQLNNSPISLSSKFIFSQTGSGSLLGTADCSMFPPRIFSSGFLWPTSPTLSLSLRRGFHLPPWQALLSCSYVIPSPGCSLPNLLHRPGCHYLLGTLLGPLLVGSSVMIAMMIGPRRSVSRVPHILINRNSPNKTSTHACTVKLLVCTQATICRQDPTKHNKEMAA